MRVETLYLHNIDSKRWNELLANSGASSVFHTIEWMRVWNLTYKNATPLFLVIRDKSSTSGAFLCGLPIIEIQKFGFKSYYSMPYGDYGGLLFNSCLINTEDYANIFYTHLRELTRGRFGMLAIYDFYNSIPHSVGVKFHKFQCIAHVVLLSSSPRAIWEHSIDSTKKRLTRQAQRNQVKTLLVRDEADVLECYEILKDTAKRHKRKMKFPLEFYINLFHSMNKFLRCSIAIRDSQKLATAINLLYKDTITYWDAGSYTNALKYRPNDALIWDTIQWGCENNYKYFDLRGSPTFKLARFKKQWGGQEKYYPFYCKMSPLFRTIKMLTGKWEFALRPKLLIPTK